MFLGLVTVLRRVDPRGGAVPNFVVCLCRHLFIIVILCPVLSPFGPSLAFNRFSEPFRTFSDLKNIFQHSLPRIENNPHLPALHSFSEGGSDSNRHHLGLSEPIKKSKFFSTYENLCKPNKAYESLQTFQAFAAIQSNPE